MDRFKTGDHVEIVGDIAAFCDSKIGIITAAPSRAISVIKEFTIQLADGALRNFYDFQLRRPPVTAAQLVFDSASSGAPAGMRGASQDRHLRFVDQDVDIHVRTVIRGEYQTIIGQLFVVRKSLVHAMASLMFEGRNREMAIIDHSGEFRFDEVPLGNVSIEFLVPSRRILTAFEMSARKSTA
jgi:hypothetical protein